MSLHARPRLPWSRSSVLILSLAFIADLTLSDCRTRMRFMALSGNLCSAFLLARKTCWQDLHTFSLIGTIVSHCGHTLLGGMIIKYELTELETSSHRTWPLSTTWSNMLRMRIFRSDQNQTHTQTHTHTHTQTQLPYPRCACAPRVITPNWEF